MTRLRMYDQLPPEEAVLKAFTARGVAPVHHQMMIAKLEREWPLLHRALTRLVEEKRQPKKPIPEGLCGDREDHEPHEHLSDSLGLFHCHADQERRLPYFLDKQRNERSSE